MGKTNLRTKRPTRNKGKLEKFFGLNDYGLVDLPKKISGTQISRALVGEGMGCSFCFPHGRETKNNSGTKDLRCWKRYRKTQYKVKEG